ncbi:DUF3293 domain-containing protein [Propionivibrio limicola]|uniref:DUF3293 domain-containing protein n=1 Tax=Propionivibrio limicola TaxID=167645 RepID=UPI001290A726|nr:DUF3293 domain-containing protein [Propionivibrio limicola]
MLWKKSKRRAKPTLQFELVASKTLEAAFRATTYRVSTSGGVFDLRIGRRNPAFDAFLRQQGAATWCIVTACNPGGKRSDNENPMRQERLDRYVAGHDWPTFAACNIADDSSWPDEPGYLLLQVSAEDAKKLLVEFSQAACVYGEVGSAPRLVWG